MLILEQRDTRGIHSCQRRLSKKYEVKNMDIKQTAVAGSLESSDIMVTVNPSDVQGITVQLESSVEKQFGQQIRKVIEETLKHLGVKAASVEAVDKGALDCTIKARTITAVHRAAQVEVYDWKEINSWNA